MPIDYKDYPEKWHEVSLDLRINRAQSVCECTGECGTDHEEEFDVLIAMIIREIGLQPSPTRCQAMNKTDHPVTGSKVVLTVAHLCNCYPKCANKEHLKAMCARCHLRTDIDTHVANRRRNRQLKRIAAGAFFDYSILTNK